MGRPSIASELMVCSLRVLNFEPLIMQMSSFLLATTQRKFQTKLFFMRKNTKFQRIKLGNFHSVSIHEKEYQTMCAFVLKLVT